MISAFTTSAASNQSAPVIYLLPTPSFTTNCTKLRVTSNQSAPVIYFLSTPSSTSNCTEFGVTQAMGAYSSRAGLAEMSEGVRLSKPTGLGQEESRPLPRRPHPTRAAPSPSC